MTLNLRRARLVIPGLLIGLVGLSACGGNGGSSDGEFQESSGPIDTSATLNRAEVFVATTLDPHQTPGESSLLVAALSYVYDQLFVVNSQAQPEGRLVTEWTTSEDGLTLSLQLRDDVTFRDGTPLDAAAVKVNLDRARTVESPVVKDEMAPVSKVTVTGDYSLDLTLSSPTPAIPFILAGGAGYIMNPALIKNGDPATETDGSGAYSVTEFSPGEKIVYTRDNEDYWDKAAMNFATVNVTAIPDPSALVNALRGGNVDIGSLQGHQIAGMENTPGMHIVQSYPSFFTELFLNPDIKPLDDVRVRQAINYAYDREEITDVMFPGSKPLWQNAPEGLPGYDPELEGLYPHDPAKARELLAEAGYPNGVDLGEVLVNVAMPEGLETILQEQFKEAGIQITTRRLSNSEVGAAWLEGKNAGYIGYSSYGLEFSQGSVVRWRSNQPSEMPQEFTDLLAAASDGRLSPEERAAGYAKVNRFLVEGAYSANLVQLLPQWVVSDKIVGFDPKTVDYGNTFGAYYMRYLGKTK